MLLWGGVAGCRRAGTAQGQPAGCAEAQRLCDSVAVLAYEAALAVDCGADSTAKERLLDMVQAVHNHAVSHGGAGVW